LHEYFNIFAIFLIVIPVLLTWPAVVTVVYLNYIH